jgi:hypothetical protein
MDAVGRTIEQYTQRVILRAGETVKTAQFPDFARPINQIFRIEATK